MSSIQPISPLEIPPDPIPGPLYDEAIRFINEAITSHRWHKMFSEKEEIRDNYNAVILSPYDHYTTVMPMVVEKFKKLGWDCFFNYNSDGRGPHHCFYVNKSHFKK